MERFKLTVDSIIKRDDGKLEIVFNVMLNDHRVGTGNIELNELNAEMGNKLTEHLTNTHYKKIQELATKLSS